MEPPSSATSRWTAPSKLGLGGGPLGNLFAPVADSDAAATVEAAWSTGIRLFDTAPHYGLGLSERRIGAVLGAYPRSGFALSTKVGRRLVERTLVTPGEHDEHFEVAATHSRQWDFSAKGVRRSLEDSLERLELDFVDVLLIHDPEHHLDEAVEEGLPALGALRDEGLARAIGVGSNSLDALLTLAAQPATDVVMAASRMTLLDHSALRDLVPLCRRRGVVVLAAGPFNSGLLASDDPANATFEYKAAPEAVLHRVARIAAVCKRHGSTLRQAALAFPGTIAGIDSVVFGARTASEVLENTSDASAQVPDALWEELVGKGLIDSSVISAQKPPDLRPPSADPGRER